MSGTPRAKSWLSRVLSGRNTHPKRPDPPAQVPTPLTRERVAAYLRSRDYHFVIDDDGDLTGTWDGSRFWFLLLGEQGEILQVRGRWHRQVPLDRRRAVALTANDWNRERIWPKVYLREEEGVVAVYSEVSADLEEGVTDDQLAQLIACGLGTGVQMFSSLDSHLPPPA
ncbi:type III secretion system chaperone family protein [Cellulomonas hominis]|nr:hypothetical protein AGMMS50218_06430 [Actinomycetota bacterium]